jgi:hypothetical protein
MKYAQVYVAGNRQRYAFLIPEDQRLGVERAIEAGDHSVDVDLVDEQGRPIGRHVTLNVSWIIGVESSAAQ